VGCLLVVALVGVVVYICCFRRKRAPPSQPPGTHMVTIATTPPNVYTYQAEGAAAAR